MRRVAAITAALWRANGEGTVTETEAEAFPPSSTRGEARYRSRAAQGRTWTETRWPSPHWGKCDRSRSRRTAQEYRRLAPAHGCLDGAPSPLGRLGAASAGARGRFTLAEQAVLSLVAPRPLGERTAGCRSRT